ncbi:MAG: hypothetical protein MZV63_64290 [Marinilabiliales bacterium]|nr:hypothetical protein [Marinilabiliales bacterium]
MLNRYVRHETMMIAMQYFGMAMAGVPYMGVGRNLSYRKTLFLCQWRLRAVITISCQAMTICS